MRRYVALIALVLAMLLSMPTFGLAKDFGTAPPEQAPAKKLRLGYLQGGIYKDYLPVFRSLVVGLAELGWLSNAEIPETPEAEGARGLWTWLSNNAQSQYIEFVADAFYDADWDKDKRVQVQGELINRLTTQRDINLMFAVGTWAGQDLANDKHSTSTMVLSTSDPLGAKIIKSADDSGRDHIWARVDSTRYERQVQLFQDIIGFQKLGVVYENSDVGRTLASVDEIEKVAKRNGFTIVPCYAPFSAVDPDTATANVIACHKKLAPQVDALYITHHRGIRAERMQDLMAPLMEHGIPTFAQAGSSEVRRGALLSISQANFLYVGKFYAESTARVLNGAKPREITQIFESPPKIAINLGTAEIIGYDPPVDILGAADEIYEDIEQ